MAGMGLGNFLSGLASGAQVGMSMERNKQVSEALEGLAAKKDAGQQPTQQGQATSMGLPGQTAAAPGVQQPAAPGAATTNNGVWGTIANLFK